jgi:hypothetical protein
MQVGVKSSILVLSALGVSILACNSGAPLPSSTAVVPAAPTAASANLPAAKPPNTDPRQAVIDAFTKLDSAYPYRLTETDSALICSQQLRTTDFAARDEWHATWSGCLSGEAISTGGTTYYLTNGSWSTTGEAPPGTEQEARIGELVKASLKNVQTAGNETFNGLRTFVYSFDVQDSALNITGGKVWIGAADGLPHRVQASFSISGMGVSTTLEYEYGISVNIKAPIH